MSVSDPMLSLEGAVEASPWGVPAHFGNPLAEQRELEAGNALVSLSHHGIVTVSGEDRLSWLDSMTSQRLLGLRPNESTETLLLDPNGRIQHAIRVVDDGERTWLLVDAGQAEGLAGFLLRMRFALRVEVADVSDKFAAVLVFDGGTASPALRELGLSLAEWGDPWGRITDGGIQYAHVEADEHPGADWAARQFVFSRQDLPRVAELTEQKGFRAAGLTAVDALEIRAWRPSQHGEVDERAIPHEMDWLRSAVHLTKGCYRGQETVAKVHNLGHPPRRLAMLHLDGSAGELPAAGALVFTAGSAAEGARPVGRVTRVALHHEWGGVALALLKRSVPEDAGLEVALASDDAPATDSDATGMTGTVAATQEVIVPASAGGTRRERIAAQFSSRRR